MTLYVILLYFVVLIKTDEIKRSNIYVSELSRYGRLNIAAKLFETFFELAT